MESTVDEARINLVSSVVSSTVNELEARSRCLPTARESCLRIAWKKDRGGGPPLPNVFYCGLIRRRLDDTNPAAEMFASGDASNDDAALVEDDPNSIDAK